MTPTALAKEIQKELESHGIAVQIHKAKTTNSIYMRFDYGVLNQARVGDHKGKGYAYHYEIGAHVPFSHVEKSHWNGKETERKFFSPRDVEKLITDVRIQRSNLRSKYGPDNYRKFLEEGKQKEWKW